MPTFPAQQQASAHSEQNAVVRSPKPAKSAIQKAKTHKLATIEAPSTSFTLANGQTQGHVFTPKQKSGAPVFEIDKKLNDKSQLLMEKSNKASNKDEKLEQSSQQSYAGSSKAEEAKDGKDSLR